MGEISEELAQEMRCTVTINREISLPMAFPYESESWLHARFAAVRAVVPYHAGHTEWFMVRNFLAVVLWLLALLALGKGLSIIRIGIAVVIYLLPFPVDAFLFLFAAFLSQFVLLAAAIGLILYAASFLI